MFFINQKKIKQDDKRWDDYVDQKCLIFSLFLAFWYQRQSYGYASIITKAAKVKGNLLGILRLKVIMPC